MKELASEICDTVRLGKLVEAFNAASVKAACPSWAERTYFTFLGKHGVGNRQTTELFVRVGRGLYRLNSK